MSIGRTAAISSPFSSCSALYDTSGPIRTKIGACAAEISQNEGEGQWSGALKDAKVGVNTVGESVCENQY